jgi:hypothetical protein
MKKAIIKVSTSKIKANTHVPAKVDPSFLESLPKNPTTKRNEVGIDLRDDLPSLERMRW